MLEQGQATTPPAAGAVRQLEPRGLSELGSRLDVLATWLFVMAGIVFCFGLIAAVLALSTNFDTLGIVSPQVESRSRLAIAAALFGGGLGGAGIVAGLAGILKALVRRRDL